MLKVFVRPAAREELAEAFRWYEARAVGLGHESLRAVRVAFGALERTPELGPVVLDDIRHLPLARFPYVMYYVVEPAGRSVLAVIHGHRHPRRWQSRRGGYLG